MTGDPGTPCRVAERFGDILLLEEIRRLAGDRKALILVHSGEPDPVKGAADLVGDDLALLRAAASSGSEDLVIAAPRTVADTVQLLCPAARVICPVPGDGCAPDPGTAAILEARQDHPEAALIVGVRSSLEAKTLADITSTPEIVMEVVEAMEADEILVAVPGLDTTTLPETWAGGKEIMAVPVLPWDRIEGDSPCNADSGASDVPSHVAEAGRGKGAFFPRHGTICHGKTETTIVDLYRSLVTGEPRVIIPRDLLSQARRPVLRMKDVLGWQP